MNHHHDSILGIPVAAILMSAPWLLPWVTTLIEEYHWLTAMIILPTFGIVLAVLNVAYMIRKHKNLGGKKPE